MKESDFTKLPDGTKVSYKPFNEFGSKPPFWNTNRLAQIAEIIIYVIACAVVFYIGWQLR